MKQHLHRSIVFVGLLALAATSPSAADRRPITETDLFKFVWVADPQMAPDGSQIAFVRVTVDEKKDQYDTSIWLAKTDGSQPPRQMTGGTRDSSPRWSPDGRLLAFVRSVEKDGRGQPPQIHLMSMTGGEARPITTLARGAANPAWSPDGKRIAFSSQTNPDELKQKDAKEEKPRETDVKVITEAVYRANGVSGSGYTDPDRPSQIWTVAAPTGDADADTPKRVTSGEFSAGNHRWSVDGSQRFVSNRQNSRTTFRGQRHARSRVTAESQDGSPASTGPSALFAVARRETHHVRGDAAWHTRALDSQPDLFVVDIPEARHVI
jgi:dipeptidyl aminopeptidase/acylaminoacyl peptidase